MENVLTGAADWRAIDATTELESMPPLRNAPSGTSAIMRIEHGFVEEADQFLARGGLGESGLRLFGRNGQAPIAADFDAAGGVVIETAGGRELADRAEGRVRVREVAELKVEAQGLLVELERERRPRRDISARSRTRCPRAARRNRAASCRSGRGRA